MSIIARSGLGPTFAVGLLLSFVSAKGCLGGNVSLGNADGSDAGDGVVTAGSGSMTVGESGSSGHGANASAGTTTQHGAGAPASDGTEPLAITVDGHVASTAPLGVSGSLYLSSDAVGADGTSSSGACEVARHTAAQCAVVTTPWYSAAGVLDWSGGLMCTSGAAERVLDKVGVPGNPDYGAMWGAALGFSFLERDGKREVYDASAHQVVGIAFDIDRVPVAGLRVEFVTDAAPNEPAVWQSSLTQSPGNLSPVHAGHNEVPFTEVRPLLFYEDQSPFDPTQLRSVQVHVPSTTSARTTYAYCLSNVSLVTGTPAPREDGCTGSDRASSGFAYNADAACISTGSSVIACNSPSDPHLVIPSAPALSNLPCVRRLADDQLFLALRGANNPLEWRTAPMSRWSRLSSTDFAECTADEAAALAAASPCSVLPI